ncbi:hypothetical protein QJS64_04015 [Paraclostridium bifermentans]|uniref:Uncharacterized protein n=1 Tax=Paraclostridium bifermentans TaxID=1490 RepID=A0ABY8R497_PARBF|nr:hypothetical protein QJS64_04015 [Paraclostridium bifermentans]
MERSIAVNKRNLVFKNIGQVNFLDTNTLVLCLFGFLLSRAMVVDNIAPLGVAFSYVYLL